MTKVTIPSAEGSHSRLSAAGVTRSLELFDLGNGRKVSTEALRTLLPDVETALFFAKAYDLKPYQVRELINHLFHQDVIDALLNEGAEHSTELQDYLVETFPEEIEAIEGVGYSEDVAPPDTFLLKQAWDNALVEVADSIKKVAESIGGVLDAMSSKYGRMTFEHMRKLNVQRNSIGTYGAQIKHERVAPRLVVLDVSGSMSQGTVMRIVDEVVGLAYGVDAAMAIVSNNAYFWEAGSFTTADILAKAEYGGTQYEQLVPIFDRDWETVVTIADYDSSRSTLAGFRKAKGNVDTVIDISLVNRPTFLAECVGQRAREVKPILVGNGHYVLT